MRVRPETHAERAHLQPRAIAVREPDIAAAISERLLEYHGMNRTLVSEVDPIVGTVDRTVDHVLRIRKGEAGEDLLAHISLTVSLGVFEKPDVRSRCDQNASPPAHHSVGHDDMIREHRASVGYPIAVSVFKQNDSPYRSRIQGIARVFGDINSPVLVPVHR